MEASFSEPSGNVASRSNHQDFAARSTISQVDLSDLQSAVAPLVQGLIAAKHEMTLNFEQANEAVGKILEIYLGRQDVVDGAQEVWKKEEEQAEEIKGLKTTMKILYRDQADDEERHKNELVALDKRVEAEKKENAEVGSRYEREYRDRETHLEEKEKKQEKIKEDAEKEQKKNKEAAEKELQLTKEKMRKDQKNFIENLEKKNTDLNKENLATKTQLLESRDLCEIRGRAYKDIREEKISLQSQITKIQQDTETPEQEDKDLWVDHL